MTESAPNSSPDAPELTPIIRGRTPDDYSLLARHYDASYEAKDTLGPDIAFYVELAKRLAVGERVLEVGCGTGRVLLPTAHAGVAIDGVDASPDMLGVLREKLKNEPPEIRDRVRLFDDDMRALALDDRYALITVPFRPLQHLYTVDDQVRGLTELRQHLTPGGRLVFDVFRPNFTMLDTDLGVEKLELTFPDPDDSGITITRAFVRNSVDPIAQVFSGDFIFRFHRGGADGDVEREMRVPLQMSYYTMPHLEALVRLAHLRVVESYGDFERAPLGEGKEIILICEATD